MKPRLNIAGMTFGRLTVIELAEVRKSTRWLCRCSCGVSVVVDGSKLTGGRTRSCGCLMRESRRALRPVRKHGHSYASGPSPTYRSWYAMIQRCTNPRNGQYKGYGGRGIIVCERWLSFENFLTDLGERPAKTTIDRIDNDRGYEPGNCRWSTGQEQCQNTSRTKLSPDIVTLARSMVAGGKSITATARALGVSRSTLGDAVNGKSWSNILAHAIAHHDEEQAAGQALSDGGTTEGA